jgi:hypothetical protein
MCAPYALAFSESLRLCSSSSARAAEACPSRWSARRSRRSVALVRPRRLAQLVRGSPSPPSPGRAEPLRVALACSCSQASLSSALPAGYTVTNVRGSTDGVDAAQVHQVVVGRPGQAVGRYAPLLSHRAARADRESAAVLEGLASPVLLPSGPRRCLLRSTRPVAGSRRRPRRASDPGTASATPPSDVGPEPDRRSHSPLRSSRTQSSPRLLHAGRRSPARAARTSRPGVQRVRART